MSIWRSNNFVDTHNLSLHASHKTFAREQIRTIHKRPLTKQLTTTPSTLLCAIKQWYSHSKSSYWRRTTTPFSSSPSWPYNNWGQRTKVTCESVLKTTVDHLPSWFLHVQYRSNVSWQSRLETQSSILDAFKNRESSFKARVKCYVL